MRDREKMSNIRGVVAVLALVIAASGFLTVPAGLAADGEVRKVAFHVNDNDKRRMNITLNNAENVYNHYKAKGEKVQIRIVAYNAGLHMLREDTSPVKERIARMALMREGLSFAACGNTHKKMTKKEGKKPPLISEAKIVPSGVVELIALQRQGWTYVKP